MENIFKYNILVLYIFELGELGEYSVIDIISV